MALNFRFALLVFAFSTSLIGASAFAEVETNILFPAQIQGRAVRSRRVSKRRAQGHVASRRRAPLKDHEIALRRESKTSNALTALDNEPLAADDSGSEKLRAEQAWRERQADEKMFQEVLGERR